MSSADVPVNPKKLAKDKLKQKKLEKGYKLPKEIIVVPNPDKVSNEKWSKSRAKDLANFPCPSRFIVVGRPGMGKSNAMLNVLLHARPLYDIVVLVHPDSGVSKEWDVIEPSYVFEEPPGAEFFEGLVDSKGKFPKTAIIIDDLEVYKARKDVLANIATLMRYYSTHRFITTFLSYQSWFDVPNLFRKLGNVFLIWRPLIINEFGLIENRLGMKKGHLKHLFDTLCSSRFDFITLDHSIDSPAPLRLGLFKKITIDDSSDDDNHSEPDLVASGDECDF